MHDWTRQHRDRIRQRLESIGRTPDWLQDLLLAIVVCDADLLIVVFGETEPGPFGVVPPSIGAAVVVLISLPLVFRRANPGLVMMLTGFAAAAAGALGIPNQALAPLVALYTVAAYLPLIDTVVSTGIFLAITTGLVITGGDLPLLYSNTLIVVGVAVIGRIVQANRLQSLQLQARSAQLERGRDAHAQLAVTSERERIARDMHDVLAHSTSVMVVQATGARRMLPDRPEPVAEALRVIEETGRQSLGELRRMLGLLREETAGAQPPRPQPGLADIGDLVQTFVAAGLPVVLRQPRILPAQVDASVALSTYRVVQEALTNAMKHSDAGRVIVDVFVLPDRLKVEVLDDGGRGQPAPRRRRRGGDRDAVLADVGSGFGLVGMRERAALVGGTVQAGPRPGGGFRVAAEFPLSAPDAPPPQSPLPGVAPQTPLDDEAARTPAGQRTRALEGEAR